MITHVIALRGNNAGQLGYLKGDLSQRISRGITRFMVHFPQRDFPWDLKCMGLKSIRPATKIEIEVNGYKVRGSK